MPYAAAIIMPPLETKPLGALSVGGQLQSCVVPASTRVAVLVVTSSFVVAPRVPQGGCVWLVTDWWCGTSPAHRGGRKKTPKIICRQVWFLEPMGMIGGEFRLWFRQRIHLSYGSSVTDSAGVLFYIDRGKIWPLGVSVLAEKLNGTLNTFFGSSLKNPMVTFPLSHVSVKLLCII